MSYTNYDNIPLVLGVWLAANDGYDLKPKPNTISATSLMRPTRSLILGNRVASSPTLEEVVDISDLIPARLGTAVHTAAEHAWVYARDVGLKNMGIPQTIIDKIKLNPDTPSEDPRFDIYSEIRSEKQIGKWTISGKFDFVEQGRVKDVKTTKVYNWIHGSNDSKYVLQGSIYRWLNQDIITDDFIDILMIFTDWSPLSAQADKNYPQKRILVRTLPLLSIFGTESYIRERLGLLDKYQDAKQEDMPQCTPEELWQRPMKYAYYKNPKAKKATRVFDTYQEAVMRQGKDRTPGSVIVKRESEPKFCNYCSGRSICLQAEGYLAQGLLKR